MLGQVNLQWSSTNFNNIYKISLTRGKINWWVMIIYLQHNYVPTPFSHT
jgi:hypothetical protein